MNQKLVFLFSILFITGVASGQFATNFTVNDCKGTPYDLFAELDAGKVIVLCWVMPCGSCILPATSAYNVARSYATTHPGKVEMYVIDDYANTSCNDINNWCHVYGLDSTIRFSNKAINMKDYGTDGMPKTVVVSGVWHKVYFNQNNAVNVNNLKAAIDLALTETSVNEPAAASQLAEITVMPNPLQGSGIIEIGIFQPGEAVVKLYDATGREIMTVFEGNLDKGRHQMSISTSGIKTGMYHLRFVNEQGSITRKIVIID